MKYLQLFVLIALIQSCAPSKKIVKGDYPKPFEFELIDTVTGSKNDIYVRAHQWISKTYGSAKTVIDMQDKEAGKLIGKAIMDVKSTTPSLYGKIVVPGTVNYIISIDVKEGKYRCVISDFRHSAGSSKVGSNIYTGTSFGDLNKEMVTYNSTATGKPTENKDFYLVKNQVMDIAKGLLADLKEKMHQKDKDF